MDNSLELESMTSLGRSHTNLPSIKEENEDRLSVLVDKLEDAINIIKLREDEIKRLDATIYKLNEISTNYNSNSNQMPASFSKSLTHDETKNRKKYLTLGICLTVASVIALVILMVGFGFLLSFIFEK